MLLCFHLFSIIIFILLRLKVRKKILYFLLFISSFVCFLFSTIFIVMISYGESMIPNYYDKAILFFWQQDFDIKRNDVVAVRYPEKWSTNYEINFKRVIGLPGDEIQIVGDQLFINGRKTWYWDQALNDILMGIENGRIKEDYYFIQGDNYFHSLDSRYIGFVHRSRILGKLLFIIYEGERPPGELMEDAVS
ncbi:MAG TPA: signal peptidase I [Bacilli bacterium]